MVSKRRKRKHEDKISEVFDTRIATLKQIAASYGLDSRKAEDLQDKANALLAEGIIRQIIELYKLHKHYAIQLNTLSDKFFDMELELTKLRYAIKGKKR